MPSWRQYGTPAGTPWRGMPLRVDRRRAAPMRRKAAVFHVPHGWWLIILGTVSFFCPMESVLRKKQGGILEKLKTFLH